MLRSAPFCPTRNAAVSSRLSSHFRSSPTKLVRLSATNRKSNIDKLGRSVCRSKSQQLMLKVLFLPLVWRGMGEAGVSTPTVSARTTPATAGGSRPRTTCLRSGQSRESDAVIIGGSPGEESCGFVLHI